MNDPRPPEGYWLNAVVPLGPAKAELLKLLREAEPTTYSQVCRDFAVMRAQELCLTYTNDELAVRDGLFVWTVYNFELVTCLRRVLAKTKWRYIWTIMSEAQCAFVDEVEKIRQRRCAQDIISESPAPSWDVCCAPAALPAHQENVMAQDEVNRAAAASVKQGLAHIAERDRQNDGWTLQVNVVPGEDDKLRLSPASPVPPEVSFGSIRGELESVAVKLLQQSGFNPTFDRGGGITFAITFHTAWKTVGK